MARSENTDSALIFLTGFTGFLGQQLSLQLLRKRPECRLAALVRPTSMPRAQAQAQRLQALFPHRDAPSIELVSGSIERADLGVDPAWVHAHRTEVREIFHLAALYDLACPACRARQVNVEGTRNVLRFAADFPRLRRFHHTSTCYVAGTHRGTFTEEDLDVGQGFLNNYDRTKFAAEKSVRERKRDLPITIYRPAIVVGDSSSGRTDKFDGPYFVLEAMRRLGRWGIFPRVGSGRHPVNLVPVDFVSQAMAHLSALPESEGRTYHLADPHPASALELEHALMQLLSERLLLLPVPARLAAALLRPPFIERLVGLPAAAVPYFDYPVRFDTQWARRHLGKLTCPPVTRYLPRLVEFWLQARAD